MIAIRYTRAVRAVLKGQGLGYFSVETTRLPSGRFKTTIYDPANEYATMRSLAREIDRALEWQCSIAFPPYPWGDAVEFTWLD